MPTSEPNRPMNMLPLTKAPRLPNIGLISTCGASGTRPVKRSRSASVGFGIFMRPPPGRCGGAAAPAPGRKQSPDDSPVSRAGPRTSELHRLTPELTDLQPGSTLHRAVTAGDRQDGLVVAT